MDFEIPLMMLLICVYAYIIFKTEQNIEFRTNTCLRGMN